MTTRYADRSEREHLRKAARGEIPADVVFRDARLINVASGEILMTDIAVSGRFVCGLGACYEGREEVDAGGRYVAPGFIDAHVHIESAMVTPSEFGRMVVPHGVTAVVADPHEIANVAGLAGVRFMLNDARRSPLKVYVAAPSCVPATPLSTAGAELDADDLRILRNDPDVLGLAEVMNVPGVLHGDAAVLEKLQVFDDAVIDGHAPGLRGRDLCAYIAAGIGSDHECTSADEAREKLRMGMTVFLREASNAHNLDTLLPLVTPANERRLCLCTDDRDVDDLTREGSIDHLVRKAIAAGVDPVVAIRMATINTAEYFGLHERGMVVPGRLADLVLFDDIRAPQPCQVYVAGRLVAENGRMLGERVTRDPEFTRTVRVDWAKVDFAVPAEGSRVQAVVAGGDQLITGRRCCEPLVKNGLAMADPARDLLKMAVLERHGRTGRMGLGFVTGFGLQRGAIAGTVAHDHHNLVVIGAGDVSMHTAARAVAECGGGLAVAEGTAVHARLPLPIAGLMSPQPYEEVGADLERLLAAARALGCPLHDPFMTMSFLALEVIPELKLTDLGLVDVHRMETVPLFEPA